MRSLKNPRVYSGSINVAEFRKFVKVRVIRNLMALGYFNGDLSRVRIVFWGEGNDSPPSF